MIARRAILGGPMTATSQDRPLNASAPQKPSEGFAEYCAGEMEHQRNSGEAFDEPLFQEAVDLVLRKLRNMEEEGLA